MNQDKTPKIIVKATLEATFGTQERMRKHLDQLIQENRPLKDEKERDLFIRELCYSTLGLGQDEIVEINSGSGGLCLRANVEQVGYWLAYQTSNVVDTPLTLYRTKDDLYNDKKIPIEIKRLWEVFRHHLFSVFPRAKDRATSLSKEKDETGKSQGFKV